MSDTITAIATPPGVGAVAIVRLAGPEAGRILLRICPALRGTLPSPREQRLLDVHHPLTGERIDRALVCRFAAPHSYTGEETVEISTHGGALTPSLVLAALEAAGARAARRGEFTHLALLNGKLDLLQAEAILDLIEGRSEALHRVALHQMDRGMSLRIEELRSAVLRAEALIVYEIDFPEEDEPPVGRDRIVEAADAGLARIEALLATAPQGEMLREGALLVLAGRPNSGKSSLFNALLGVDRAIVTALPGTTRDAIEAELSLEGYPFRLVDTAGLRVSTDLVEKIGIEVAERYLGAADLLLYCAEAGREITDEERAFLAAGDPGRTLYIRTKSDLVPTAFQDDPQIRVSANSGEGLADLREALLARVFGTIRSLPGEAPVVTRERHARVLAVAAGEVRLFLDALEDEVPMELAATHLRRAAEALESLIGAVTPDDVLGEVFGRFCVGK